LDIFVFFHSDETGPLAGEPVFDGDAGTFACDMVLERRGLLFLENPELAAVEVAISFLEFLKYFPGSELVKSACVVGQDLHRYLQFEFVARRRCASKPDRGRGSHIRWEDDVDGRTGEWEEGGKLVRSL
jgi:hypothetical protein